MPASRKLPACPPSPAAQSENTSFMAPMAPESSRMVRPLRST